MEMDTSESDPFPIGVGPLRGIPFASGGVGTALTVPLNKQTLQVTQRQVDVAWAAGVFEGEGCISHTTYKDKKYPRLSVGMTDKDIVERFTAIVGYGSVSGPKQQKANWKPRYDWQVCNRKEVQRILSMFLPWLGNRRAYKALNALDNIELA